MAGINQTDSDGCAAIAKPIMSNITPTMIHMTFFELLDAILVPN